MKEEVRKLPIVKIDLTTGRNSATKRDLIRAVTTAVQNSLGVEPRDVRVLLNEVDPNCWAVGGETLAEREITRPQLTSKQ